MPRKFLNGIDLTNQKVINLSDPSAATDAANKQYVDNKVNGLDWKPSVRAATTAAGTLATSFENGDVIDGVTLATGDRFLYKDAASGADNGIYVVNATGAPTRAADADSAGEISPNLTVYVEEGTVNADKSFTLTNNGAVTIGTTALVFAQVGGGTTYTADGNGLELTSTTFGLELDGTTLSKSSAGLRVGSGAAGAGLTEASGVLAVGTGTGISVTADAVAVDTAVVTRKYSVSVGNASLTAIAVTHNLGTRDVQVQVYDNATYETVEVDAVRTDTNTVTLTFATAPGSNAYRCVVQG